MVVAPWGEVVLDAGRDIGAFVVEIDPGEVSEARRRVPAWQSEPDWDGP